MVQSRKNDKAQKYLFFSKNSFLVLDIIGIRCIFVCVKYKKKCIFVVQITFIVLTSQFIRAQIMLLKLLPYEKSYQFIFCNFLIARSMVKYLLSLNKLDIKQNYKTFSCKFSSFFKSIGNLIFPVLCENLGNNNCVGREYHQFRCSQENALFDLILSFK